VPRTQLLLQQSVLAEQKPPTVSQHVLLVLQMVDWPQQS